MKKCICIITFLLAFSSLCWAGGQKEQQTKTSAQTNQQQTAATQTPINTPPVTAQNPYFTGDGGKGMSLGVGVPKSQGLTKDQDYLPALVQGILADSIKKYSAISVVDRISLDRVIAETLDPTFEDNLDIVRLGHVAQVGNWLTGNIIKTSTGYTLQVNITDTTPNAITVASYTGTCTVAEFDNHSAIHKASLALLEQMGVALTQRTKDELTRASSQQYVNAQTALSQGITAQRQGTVIEALVNYYQAASFDPTLLEAANRVSVLSTTITSGDIGENVRNDIQRRDEWLRIINQAATFFKKQLPFEIVFNPVLSQGVIDYNRRTVDLSFTMWVNPIDSAFQALSDIKKGLYATGRAKNWDLDYWPLNNPGRGSNLLNRIERFALEISLINEDGKEISKIIANDFYQGNRSLTIEIDSLIFPSPFIFSFKNPPATYTFRSVNANDITDTLTIKITSVNGVNLQNPANQGYISIRTGITSTGYSTSPGNSVTIPNGVTTIKNFEFSRKQLTSVTIPNSVTSIGNMAFFDNILTSVTIPNSVTSIGDMAFFANILISSVTIGANVKLGEESFGFGFEDFYAKNGRKAGTYTLMSNNRWNYSPR